MYTYDENRTKQVDVLNMYKEDYFTQERMISTKPFLLKLRYAWMQVFHYMMTALNKLQLTMDMLDIQMKMIGLLQLQLQKLYDSFGHPRAPTMPTIKK